jgi:hypothetical protein
VTRAGDGVFLDPAASILSALRAGADVQRVFVGFLDVFNGATSPARQHVRGRLYARDQDRVDRPPRRQARRRPGARLQPRRSAFLTDGNVRRVARAFYRVFDDSYDF